MSKIHLISFVGIIIVGIIFILPVKAQSKKVTSRLYVPLTNNSTLIKEGNKESMMVKDYLGSTRVVDSDGTIDAGSYFPYGKETNFQFSIFNSQINPNDQNLNSSLATQNSELGTLTDKSFTGHRSLTDSDILHMAARFYNPQTGSFIQPDVAEGPNRFVYVGGNPISNNDPTGLSMSAGGNEGGSPYQSIPIHALSYGTGFKNTSEAIDSVPIDKALLNDAQYNIVAGATVGMSVGIGGAFIAPAAMQIAAVNGTAGASIEGMSQVFQRKFDARKLATSFAVGAAVPPLLGKAAEFTGPVIGGATGKLASAIASNPYTPIEVNMLPYYVSGSRAGSFLAHFLKESGNALPIVAVGAVEDIGKYGLTTSLWTNWVLSKFAVKINMVAKAGVSLTERLPISEGLQERLLDETLPKGFKYGSMYAFRGNPATKQVYEQYVEPVEQMIVDAFSPKKTPLKTQVYAR